MERPLTVRIFQKGFNFSQDGPGNRLIYHLQGCNLHCPWCSNPEGMDFDGGKDCPVDDLVEEARRSRMMFFENGGVTLTGGEVTMQIDAAAGLLKRLKACGITTCIETNGTSPRLRELFPFLDYLIMDVKHYDPEKHAEVTGLRNEVVFENVRAAIDSGMNLSLRIPLIGGFNASFADAEGFAELFRRLGAIGKATVELLPYHEYGKDKYRQLDREYSMDDSAKVDPGTLAEYSRILRDSGMTVIRT